MCMVCHRGTGSEHLNLFAHLQLGEQIYWLIEVGSAPNQTGNLIEFYNKNFIPLCKVSVCMYPHTQITHTQAHKRACALSPFISLPAPPLSLSPVGERDSWREREEPVPGDTQTYSHSRTLTLSLSLSPTNRS
jgi:hypothetical protein